MRTSLVIWVVAASALVGCGGSDETTGPRPGNTYATDVRTDPELMHAVPTVVTPGGEIDAVFPRGSTRGPGFVLERASAQGWGWHFALSSDTDAPNMVNVFTAEEFARRNIEWNSGPAFDGTDPHRIPVPDDAEAGRWRVCTAPDTPGLCAEFEVAEES